MPSNHLIFCCPLLLLPSSIFPSIRVFSNESALCIRWPKYWSFSFSISPSNEYSGLISFRIDWFHSQESSPAPHFKSWRLIIQESTRKTKEQWVFGDPYSLQTAPISVCFSVAPTTPQLSTRSLVLPTMCVQLLDLSLHPHSTQSVTHSLGTHACSLPLHQGGERERERRNTEWKNTKICA